MSLAAININGCFYLLICDAVWKDPWVSSVLVGCVMSGTADGLSVQILFSLSAVIFFYWPNFTAAIVGILEVLKVNFIKRLLNVVSLVWELALQLMVDSKWNILLFYGTVQLAEWTWLMNLGTEGQSPVWVCQYRTVVSLASSRELLYS